MSGSFRQMQHQDIRQGKKRSAAILIGDLLLSNQTIFYFRMLRFEKKTATATLVANRKITMTVINKRAWITSLLLTTFSKKFQEFQNHLARYGSHFCGNRAPFGNKNQRLEKSSDLRPFDLQSVDPAPRLGDEHSHNLSFKRRCGQMPRPYHPAEILKLMTELFEGS